MTDAQELINDLRTRANIRRNAVGRKSVQEGKPDRISNLLEKAADNLEWYEEQYSLSELHREYMDRRLCDLIDYNKELLAEIEELRKRKYV